MKVIDPPTIYITREEWSEEVVKMKGKWTDFEPCTKLAMMRKRYKEGFILVGWLKDKEVYIRVK